MLKGDALGPERLICRLCMARTLIFRVAPAPVIRKQPVIATDSHVEHNRTTLSALIGAAPSAVRGSGAVVQRGACEVEDALVGLSEVQCTA
jgi:hypothetical protein